MTTDDICAVVVTFHPSKDVFDNFIQLRRQFKNVIVVDNGSPKPLLDDLRKHPERFINGALRRLRFYYPKTYASLTGDDLKKREAFETEEKEDRVRR